MKVFKAGRRNSEKGAVPEEELTSPPPLSAPSTPLAERRRERKSKFSVKDIFNFRKQGSCGFDDDGVKNAAEAEAEPLKSEGAENKVSPVASSVHGGLGARKRFRRPSNVKSVSACEVRSYSEETRPESGSAHSSMSDVDDSVLVRTPVAAICNGGSAVCLKEGGLLTKRGKQSASSRDKEEEDDRNGNSPQVLVPIALLFKVHLKNLGPYLGRHLLIIIE